MNKDFAAGYHLTPSIIQDNHKRILYCIIYGLGKYVSVFSLKMLIQLTWFMSYLFSTFQRGESVQDASRTMWNLTEIFLSYKTIYFTVFERFPAL